MSSVVVVGGGIFGLSCALSLVDQGWSATVVERDLTWERASSGGDTRLLRLSHGGDTWHRDSARLARQGWVEWSERTGTELYRETGAVWMAAATDGWVARSRQALVDAGDLIEDLDERRLGDLLPGIVPSGVEVAYLELGAGVLFADRCREALLSLVRAQGARVVTDEVRSEHGAPVGHRGRYEGDVTIWACGPWLAGLFPDVVHIEVTQQDLVNVAAPAEWHNAPAWLDVTSTWYGTGDVGTGLKVANDAAGSVLDPAATRRDLGPTTIDDVRTYLQARFPALADADIMSTGVCQYSRTPDSEFIVAAHPVRSATWIVGGGSGHGFKHGPSLGGYVADVVEGRREPLHRHRLGPRQASTGLRLDDR